METTNPPREEAVKVRRAMIGDAPILAEYNRRMAWETEAKELDPKVLGPGVAKVFDDPAKGFYLVAEADVGIVGQLMITYEWSDWRNGWFWWIQSVYVVESHRRRGVFRALVDEVKRLAAVGGDVIGLRLYVETENVRAQATYRSAWNWRRTI
jgi:GNAT superfamily N-acetyltransferase